MQEKLKLRRYTIKKVKILDHTKNSNELTNQNYQKLLQNKIKKVK